MAETLPIPEGEASPTPKEWCFWSTTETIQNEVPSLTAILETIIAVPLYWWIALQIGVIYPLLVSVLIAPLVLLRSDESVALGVSWFLRVDKRNTPQTYEGLSPRLRRVFWVTTAIYALASIPVILLMAHHITLILEGYSATFTIVIIVITAIISTCTVFAFLSTFLTVILSMNNIQIIIFDKDIYFILFIPDWALGVLLPALAFGSRRLLSIYYKGSELCREIFGGLPFVHLPIQIPELVPGIENSDSRFRFEDFFYGAECSHPFIAVLR